MPQHKMTAKFLPDRQRLLQIYAHSSFPGGSGSAKGSFTYRLCREIGRNPFSMELRNRKATPIYRNAFRHRQRARQSGGMNRHATAHVGQRKRVQQSDMFNDSRKHRAASPQPQSPARTDEYS